MSDRPSPIAGTWYPGSAAVLTRDIRTYLDRAAGERPAGEIRAIVVPHAGYAYSGQIAAWAFGLVAGLHPEVVAVLSPLHYAHPARLLTSGHDAYRTPLGRVKIDQTRVEALRARLGFGLTPLLEDEEHSLEIELPFLQELFGDFLLIPVMLRDQSWPTVQALAEALTGALAGCSSLIVASSDLSHFHPQRRAEELDREFLRRLGAFDPKGVLDAEAEGVGSACGRGAIAAALVAARGLGANRVSVVRHGTSGDVTGDRRSVVGYGAAVVWQERM